jgi:hypothetical protein
MDVDGNAAVASTTGFGQAMLCPRPGMGGRLAAGVSPHAVSSSASACAARRASTTIAIGGDDALARECSAVDSDVDSGFAADGIASTAGAVGCGSFASMVDCAVSCRAGEGAPDDALGRSAAPVAVMLAPTAGPIRLGGERIGIRLTRTDVIILGRADILLAARARGDAISDRAAGRHTLGESSSSGNSIRGAGSD